MKVRCVLAALVVLLAGAGAAVAQEHWTEGPVWEISYYRTAPGHFDDYLNYLRAQVEPQNLEAEKQGLVLGNKILLNTPTGPDDWDIAFVTMHKNLAALDYNADVDAKGKAIAEKHYKTADENKQRELTAPRLEWRTYLGSKLVREVTLRPAK